MEMEVENTLFLASRSYLIVYSKLSTLSTLVQKKFTKHKFSILKIAEFTLRLYFLSLISNL